MVLGSRLGCRGRVGWERRRRLQRRMEPVWRPVPVSADRLGFGNDVERPVTRTPATTRTRPASGTRDRSSCQQRAPRRRAPEEIAMPTRVAVGVLGLLLVVAGAAHGRAKDPASRRPRVRRPGQRSTPRLGGRRACCRFGVRRAVVRRKVRGLRRGVARGLRDAENTVWSSPFRPHEARCAGQRSGVGLPGARAGANQRTGGGPRA